MSSFGVVLDACVPIPATLRDTLLRAVEKGMYRLHWSKVYKVVGDEYFGNAHSPNLPLNTALNPALKSNILVLENYMTEIFSTAQIENLSAEIDRQLQELRRSGAATHKSGDELKPDGALSKQKEAIESILSALPKSPGKRNVIEAFVGTA